MRETILLVTLAALLCCCGMARAQSDYCVISREHTMCKFTGTGDKCVDLSARGMDELSKQEVLRAHNAMRSRVATGQETRGIGGPQPTAANMQLMTWDDELAAVAQRWADQCTFQHDCNDCRRVGRFFVGQNLYTEGSTSARGRAVNWNAAVAAWYDEVAEFSNANIDQFRFSAATGHYTQVVWATSNKVGCGFTTYRTGAFTSNLYVCNYGPAGNTIFAEMYKKGLPCSRCPSGTTCSSQFPGLCAPISIEEMTNSIPSEKPAGTKPVTEKVPELVTKPLIIPVSEISPASPAPTQQPVKPLPLPTSTFSPFVPNVPGFTTAGPTTKEYFACSIGRGPCRGSFAGAPWAFKNSRNVNNRRQAADYIESTIFPTNVTEFRIDKELPAPSSDRLCLGVSLLRELINPDNKQLILSPLVIYVQPQASKPAVIRLDNVTPNPDSGWLEARVTLRGVKTPFKMGFQQSGPQISNGIIGPNLPAIRLSLNKLKLSNGSCN